MTNWFKWLTKNNIPVASKIVWVVLIDKHSVTFENRQEALSYVEKEAKKRNMKRKYAWEFFRLFPPEDDPEERWDTGRVFSNGESFLVMYEAIK